MLFEQMVKSDRKIVNVSRRGHFFLFFFGSKNRNFRIKESKNREIEEFRMEMKKREERNIPITFVEKSIEK